MSKNNMQADKIIANVTASLAVEGLKQSATGLELNKKYLSGELTSQETIQQIIANYYILE